MAKTIQKNVDKKIQNKKIWNFFKNKIMSEKKQNKKMMAKNSK